jgi:hypothetical protein
MRAWKNLGRITSVETVQNPMFETAPVEPTGAGEFGILLGFLVSDPKFFPSERFFGTFF